jgi:ketosteroid isomerase-like protein
MNEAPGSGPSGKRRVELVRAGMEAYNAGDIETVLATLAEDIEIYSPPELLNSGTFRGHDGFLEWIETWNDAWESFDIAIEVIEPVGERHVVADVRQTARGAGSGIEIDQRVAYLWEVRDDETCSYQGLYANVEDAYAAAREREASE